MSAPDPQGRGAPRQDAAAPDGAGAPMTGQLAVRVRGETLRALPLSMRLLSLGRTPDNGLPLTDPGVAIRHAELARGEGGQLTLTDLGNGATFLNGRRLTPHAPSAVVPGDELQIGPFTLTYTETESAPLPVAAPIRHQEGMPLRLHAPRPERPALPRAALPKAPSSYLNYLPALFEEAEFAGRYLRIVENVWEPLQSRQDHLPMYFDPRTCPPQFLTWLSGWLGLELDPRWPESRRREWVRESLTLYRWRGTRYGLTRALEIACGVTPAIIEDREQPHRLTLLVPLPHLKPGARKKKPAPAPPGPDGSEPGSGPGSKHDSDSADEQDDGPLRALVEEIVSAHAPAHVAWTLQFVPLPPAPPAPASPAPSPSQPSPDQPGPGREGAA